MREDIKAMFKYEAARDLDDRALKAAQVSEMYEAGAHLVCILKGTKMPMGEGWQQRRHSLDGIIKHIGDGHYVGLWKPQESLGLHCVDFDHGAEYVAVGVEKLGAPLAIHESSRSVDGKCHGWWKASGPCTMHKWDGGDIRSASNHQIILYNIHAVYEAWQKSLSDDVQAVSLDVLPWRGRAVVTANGNIPDGYEGDEQLHYDVPADSHVATSHRHDTMIAKIASAVMQSESKGMLDRRFKVIAKAHKAAFEGETDQARLASLSDELDSAAVFKDGAWAKRKAFNKHAATIIGYAEAVPEAKLAKEPLAKLAEEYEAECVNHGWPTPYLCKQEVNECFKRAWEKRHESRKFSETINDAKKAIHDRNNEEINAKFKETGVGKFILHGELGSFDLWLEAAKTLGIKFRFNTFIQQGEVWIPTGIMSAKQGGGNWIDIDDRNMSAISCAIERYAKVEIERGKNVIEVGVYLNKHKESQAIQYLFSKYAYCPIKEYFKGLPDWCGERNIHKSMERGGMMIDAGPFNDQVQSFLWLFVVRNCMFPGSSMREYIALHGAHDCGKSKYVELALPPHLRRYYNGNFQLGGSMKQKLERSIGMALMESGEFGQGGKKDWDAVKSWLTLSEIKGERMAYQTFAKRHPLTATTVFTTNKPELPPTDDAVLSRFVWANVTRPATRAVDEQGNERNIVWEHFDQLYDADRPELGTWREQYFAEALAVVREKARQIAAPDGSKIWVCNLEWISANSKKELVEWNKQSGSTYITEQSTTIDDISEAISMLDEHYGYKVDDGGYWYSTADIKAAMFAIKDDVPFITWADIRRIGDPVRRDNLMRSVRGVIGDRQMGNAARMFADKRALVAVHKSKYVEKGRKSRGWVFDLAP